jgi:hypothetical protein
LALPRAPTGLAALGWKDFHLTCGGRWALIAKFLAIAVTGAIIGIWWWPDTPRDWSGLGLGAVFIGIWWVVIEVAVILSRIYAVEIRDRTLDGLLLLPVTPHGLLWRKLVALPRALLPPVVLIVVGTVMAAEKVLEGTLDAVDESGFWVVIATVVFFWSLCAFLSLRVKRAPLVMAIIAVSVSWFLITMIGGILGLFRGSGDGFLIITIVIYLLASWGMWMSLPGQLRRLGER